MIQLRGTFDGSFDPDSNEVALETAAFRVNIGFASVTPRAITLSSAISDGHSELLQEYAAAIDDGYGGVAESWRNWSSNIQPFDIRIPLSPRVGARLAQAWQDAQGDLIAQADVLNEAFFSAATVPAICSGPAGEPGQAACATAPELPVIHFDERQPCYLPTGSACLFWSTSLGTLTPRAFSTEPDGTLRLSGSFEGDIYDNFRGYLSVLSFEESWISIRDVSVSADSLQLSSTLEQFGPFSYLLPPNEYVIGEYYATLNHDVIYTAPELEEPARQLFRAYVPPITITVPLPVHLRRRFVRQWEAAHGDRNAQADALNALFFPESTAASH